jgi:hypothetical protein
LTAAGAQLGAAPMRAKAKSGNLQRVASCLGIPG